MEEEAAWWECLTVEGQVLQAQPWEEAGEKYSEKQGASESGGGRSIT